MAKPRSSLEKHKTDFYKDNELHRSKHRGIKPNVITKNCYFVVSLFRYFVRLIVRHCKDSDVKITGDALESRHSPILLITMIKKLLIISFSLFFLAACGKSDDVKIDFKGPTSAPDISKMKPTYGPNDPVPVTPPTQEQGQPSK
jgi:hypothetical protein